MNADREIQPQFKHVHILPQVKYRSGHDAGIRVQKNKINEF